LRSQAERLVCGICGEWRYSSGEPVDRDALDRMRDTMVHRGPEGSGSYFDDSAGIGLGFRRLAIIDLSPAGRQPMTNEDGSVWVVCNGEIYNAPELRTALEHRGHVFRSRSDSEVIVHAYEEHGERCVHALDGMFGFAVWDALRRRLLLARDRVGEKPLYYYDNGKRLLFASELKAIVADPGVQRTLDWHSFGQFLSLGAVDAPGSILVGIRKLPSAHYMTVESGVATIKAYWDWLPALQNIDHARSEHDWIAETRAAFQRAVRRQMASDVPIGAFLSGGVDSSAVVAAMAKAAGREVKTFSIGFRAARFDETGYAREVAEHLGTEHHELFVEPLEAADVVPQLVRQYDEPFADSSAVPMLFLARLARRHVTVALSGDGGDEACAGYARYTQALRERAIDAIPQRWRGYAMAPAGLLPIAFPGRRLAQRFALDERRRYASVMRQMAPAELYALLTPDAVSRISADGTEPVVRALEKAKDLDPLSRLQYADAQVYLPSDILVKVDRASMLYSLEVRCPFLDRCFLELMGNVPPALRHSKRTGKRLLKLAMRGILPDRILMRPKMGFAVPLESWFRSDLAPFVAAVLLDGCVRELGIFGPVAVERLIRQQTRWKRLSPTLWTALIFELWCRAYLDGR
jgi:asparagine synthase (glutamine-hydrolysing)